MNSSYRFKATETGFNVYHRSTLIGEILPSKEASGRHCFYLGCDDRRHPRTYRGKIKAAEALHSIHKLAAESSANVGRYRSSSLSPGTIGLGPLSRLSSGVLAVVRADQWPTQAGVYGARAK